MAPTSSEDTVPPYVLIGAFAVLALIYFVANTTYHLFFDPLSKVPGPLLNRISYIPYIFHVLKGTTVDNTVALHKKYGQVVRITPGDVSFTAIDTAWPQIYGFRVGALKGHATHEKDPHWLGPKMFGNANSVLRAGGEEHGQQRKLLSHAFSEKALSSQEDLIQAYVDKLINQLRQVPVKTGQTFDIVEWYNWTTFDIISDLLFGESFGNLDDLRTHEHVTNMFQALRMSGINYMRKHLPITQWLDRFLVDPSSASGQLKYRDWIVDQTTRRLAKDTDRPDFMSMIMAHQGEKGTTLTDDQIKANSQLLIIAGSETTATFLSGVTWLLLKNPDVLAKLKEEVRGRWSDYEEITFSEVAKAPYLQAVISEGLRYYPPVPTGFPRQIADGGEMVSGYYIPKDTSVCVSSFAAHHDEANFTDPERFDPDRWLGVEKYANDKQSSIQPFSFGPHACLGKNLAYAEMRLILAKLIYSFDLELDSSAENWLHDCKVFNLWSKAKLNVRVAERQ